MTVQIDKLDFIRINNFCSSKDTIERMKRLTIDWRKYLQNTHELPITKAPSGIESQSKSSLSFTAHSVF